MARRWGGVVEHPKESRLWSASGCLGYGMRDSYGGVLIPVLQSWWGHDAPKASCFYVVGPVPELPVYSVARTIRSVENMCKAQRERTPPSLATWLIDAARDCVVQA